MLVSIVIPAYNGAETLPQCLEACLAQDYPNTEVIVVNDGSTDATSEVAARFEGVVVVSQENQGPAAARNHGARVARGDVLAYTDADCIPRPEWISALVARLDDDVVAVGGTYDIANPASRLARVVQAEIAVRHSQFEEAVDFLGSFNVAYSKEAFEAVGGFEESYTWASGEDNDLAYKLQDAGGCLRFTRGAVVAHFHPEGLWSYLQTQRRHGYWRVKLYRDHPKRAQGGDQYAGWPDLIAPPLSLAVAFLLPCVVAAEFLAGHGLLVLWAYGLLCFAYGILHVPIALRLRTRLSPSDLLYCWLVLCIRDLARALGLVHGVWFFGIRKCELR